MSNTLQQSTLLYTEREIKGSYWAALLYSLHATSHTLNVFSEAFTEKEAKGSFCGSSMSHILLSNSFYTERETKGSYCGSSMSHILLSDSFYTERETKGSYCGRNCIFWSAFHQHGCPPVGNPLSDVLITDKRQSIFLFQHIARIWHLRHTDTQISFRILNNSTCPTSHQIWIYVIK